MSTIYFNSSPKEILTRKELLEEKSNYLPGSPKREEMEAALRNPNMPFYTDTSSLKKYHLFALGRLLGGGLFSSKEDSLNGVVISLSDDSSLTLTRGKSGKLVGELVSSDKPIKEIDRIFINGNPINEKSDLEQEQIISFLKKLDMTLLSVNYNSEEESIFISSRPVLKNMIKGHETKEVRQDSFLESLDEDYINCVLGCKVEAGDKKFKENTINFITKYEGLLKQAKWEEEKISIMIRKAAIDGLRINLIPSGLFSIPQLMRETSSVISQFEAIEQEIKLLNLSLDVNESLDFHMYRGFVYAKFPSKYYRKQTNTAIWDATTMIFYIDQQIKSGKFQPTPLFYKKMAYAFRVFAEGIDNPSVSIEFVSMGIDFIDRSQKEGAHNDSSLIAIKEELIKMKNKFNQSMVRINLDDVFAPFPKLLLPSANDSELTSESGKRKFSEYSSSSSFSSSSTSAGQMSLVGLEKRRRTEKETELDPYEIDLTESDKILFEAYNEFNILNMSKSLKEHEEHIKKQIDPVKRFRADLRHLFLEHCLNYLRHQSDYNSLNGKFKDVLTVLDRTYQKLKNMGENVTENDFRLCLSEFHVFRGCILITYPRSVDVQHYNRAIEGFNFLITEKMTISRDLQAFQYMIYGEHMLDDNPFHAIPLLKKAVALSGHDTITSRANNSINNFFSKFDPIRPCLQLDTKKIAESLTLMEHV